MRNNDIIIIIINAGLFCPITWCGHILVREDEPQGFYTYRGLQQSWWAPISGTRIVALWLQQKVYPCIVWSWEPPCPHQRNRDHYSNHCAVTSPHTNGGWNKSMVGHNRSVMDHKSTIGIMVSMSDPLIRTVNNQAFVIMKNKIYVL